PRWPRSRTPPAPAPRGPRRWRPASGRSRAGRRRGRAGRARRGRGRRRRRPSWQEPAGGGEVRLVIDLDPVGGRHRHGPVGGAGGEVLGDGVLVPVVGPGRLVEEGG